ALLFGLGDEAALSQLFERAAARLDLRRPKRRVHVAQAPGALLDVRLLKADRRAELRVPLFALVAQGREEVVGVPAPLAFERAAQNVEECAVAREQARREQGGLEVRVGARRRDR